MEATRNHYRMELFRLRISVYKAAAQVNVNPPRLSQMLNDHIDMPGSVADALNRVIKQRETELAQAQEAG